MLNSNTCITKIYWTISNFPSKYDFKSDEDKSKHSLAPYERIVEFCNALLVYQSSLGSSMNYFTGITIFLPAAQAKFAGLVMHNFFFQRKKILVWYIFCSSETWCQGTADATISHQFLSIPKTLHLLRVSAGKDVPISRHACMGWPPRPRLKSSNKIKEKICIGISGHMHQWTRPTEP